MTTKVSLIALAISSAISAPTLMAHEHDSTSDTQEQNKPEDVIVVVGEMTNFAVTDSELESYQAQDLEDIFRTEPSVTVGGSLGVAQKVYVRGLEDTFLNVTVDGAPQTSTLFHHIGRLSIDPYLLKSVEVQAGAGEATSGAGAIGGAIRFKTKNVDDLLAPGDSFGGSVSGSYFSNSGRKASASLYGAISDDWGLMGTFVDVKNNDMKDGDGNEIPGTASDRKLGFLKVNGNIADNQTLTLSYENRNEQGDYNQRPNWPASISSTLYPMELQRHTVTANHTLTLNQLVHLETTLYHTQADVTQDVTDRWGKYNGEVRTAGLDIRNTSKVDLHSVTYGAEYRNDKAKAKSLEPNAADGHEEVGDVFGLYVQDHWQLTNQFLLSYGLRYDKYQMEQKTTDTKVNSDGFSPNVGFNYQITDNWKLNAGYAQAMRGKQVGDTFTLESKSVDPDLKAEKVDNTEVGIEYQASNWLASATVFQSAINDVISAQIGSSQYKNIGKLETKGYELKAHYWYEDLSLVASFTSFDSKLNGNTVEGYEHIGLANSRGDTFGLNLTYDVNPDIELGWNYTYVADLNNIEVLQRAVEIGWIGETYKIDKPGYQVHDIYAQWYPMSSEDLRVNFTVTNLFDQLYRDHSSVGDYSSVPGWGSVSGLYAAGRDVRVSVNYAF
ncbi:TonB-dependent receptor [Vibrio sp. SCSIO 43136]|uniref:TonB-dependent receptor domain-containing protein n=1 Tax=Vibrio sp. SCSIO 43136 TaxID=2819101 RepID=UPI00207629E2|nr:TonB-dependent receptor [Vibrio sp. SCSIO 43136]USD67319.1 TonB-dependent receptor [Vibrio sp. SCSIO 43136]